MRHFHPSTTPLIRPSPSSYISSSSSSPLNDMHYIIIIIDHHRRCWQSDNLERKRLLSLRTESDASPHIFLLLQATSKIRSDSPSVQISISIHLDSIIIDVLLILISTVSDWDVVGNAVGVRFRIFWSALNSGAVDCGF
ncbi:hypothetical protein AKJ16_DCAP24835 [Drosera capensis]